jgi:hypothetical protein
MVGVLGVVKSLFATTSSWEGIPRQKLLRFWKIQMIWKRAIRYTRPL